MSMDKLKAAVSNAVTVMDGAATTIAAFRARLATAQDEAKSKGVDIEALNSLTSDLDKEAGELAAAIAEGTAAASEPAPTDPAPTPVDPDAAANT